MYHSTIVIANQKGLEKLFAAEDKTWGRSSYTVKKVKDTIVLDVVAQDAVAFKTVMNTLAKIFIIWEKTGV
jgi:hypothetical protein